MAGFLHSQEGVEGYGLMFDKTISAELSGAQGELVLLRLAVSPHLLEDALESLAQTPFPVNPQIIHPTGQNSAANVTIEFPAYQDQVECAKQLLEKGRLPAENLEIVKMFNAIATSQT